MTVRYTHVRTYKRGVKRGDGKGYSCPHCRVRTPATVRATRFDGHFYMDVVACGFHAQQGGMTR